MPTIEQYTIISAKEDFYAARHRAVMQDILARLTGHSTDLLSFEDVKQKLKAQAGSTVGLREIPVDAIVGSVNRYRDFNRNFLPRQATSDQRWAGVKTATLEQSGVPPIDVYKVGEAYFVVDGNHRVSVAKELGIPTIQAYVTEFKTKVPLETKDQPDDLIIKAELADFLEKTQLDILRPGVDLKSTTPGRYWILEMQIEAQQLLLSKQTDQPVAYPQAVESWFDHAYFPTIQLIREKGILRDFPGRTETDMYLWIAQHRTELQAALGWEIDTEQAASDLVSEHSDAAERVLSRVEGKLWQTVLPESLEAGPEPGQWRREWLESRPRDRLFGNILTPVGHHEADWLALDQALAIARYEHSQLYGLHVILPQNEPSDAAVEAVKERFQQQCQAAGIPGRLAVVTGSDLVEATVDRARWADLVVVNPTCFPKNSLLSKLGTPIRRLLQRCPRPILTLHGSQTDFRRMLLAYDGSPKAREGLYVATYIAGKYQIPLVVTTIIKQAGDREHLAEAEAYLLDHGVTATCVAGKGPVADVILQTAHAHDCNFIVMGGYATTPLVSAVLGSSVDSVLEKTEVPVLICR